MIKTSRMRGITKWICTGGNIAVLILFLITLRWKLDWTSADQDRRIMVSRGAVVFRKARDTRSPLKRRVDEVDALLAQLDAGVIDPAQSQHRRRLLLDLYHRERSNLVSHIFTFGRIVVSADQRAIGIARWRPVLHSSPRSWRVGIPLYVPFLVFAMPAILIWRADLRRAPVGHCQHCGYNLTGNVSGRCPECGQGIA